MLKYLLLGRVGSGRNFFQKLLEKNGLTVAKSYTTRERRDENDTSHHFISESQINSFSERLFETSHDGHRYFYTRDELEKADIIPIDPENLKAVCDYFPDNIFRFIEVVASNEDRLKHAVSNADDKITAEEDFVARCEEENDAFCKFEDAIKDSTLGVDNILVGHVANNDFTSSADIYGWVNSLINYKRVFEKILRIMEKLRNNSAIVYDKETNTYALYVEDKQTKTENVLQASPDRMAEEIILNPNGMSYAMTAWLALEDTSV